jgi:hypothetical protein
MQRYKYPELHGAFVSHPDPRLVVLKGAVAAGTMCYSEVTTRRARRHYLINTPRFFSDSEDLEGYRIKELDSFNRSRYTYKTVVRKGYHLQNEEIIKFPITK